MILSFQYVLNCQLFTTPAASTGTTNILNNLYSNSAFIKCLSFRNEKEFRIAIKRSGNDQLLQQCYADNLSPYVLLKLDELSKFNNNKNFFEMFFDEIMIGPQSKINEENLMRFLALNNINNVKVTKSNSKLKR